MQAFEKPEYKEAQVSTQGIVRIDGVKVYCELLGSEKKFVICGGGHVSIPVI